MHECTITSTYVISREFDNGRLVELTLRGQLSEDDFLDAFKGFLSSIGRPDAAEKLTFKDESNFEIG